MKEIKVTRKLKQALRAHFSKKDARRSTLPPELARLPKALIDEEELRTILKIEQRQGVYD